jgi:hypothetical protein
LALCVKQFFINNITAAPLITREMHQALPVITITRMDDGVEPPWMISRRVIAGCA